MEIVNLTSLIEARADVNALGIETALMAATESVTSIPQVVQLLIHAKANLDVREPEDGETALMMAAKKTELLDHLKLLIQAGADLNVRDNQGQTASMVAEKAGNTQGLACLLGAMKNK